MVLIIIIRTGPSRGSKTRTTNPLWFFSNAIEESLCERKLSFWPVVKAAAWEC